MTVKMTILFLITALIIEVIYKPRLEFAKDRLLLFYGKNRKYIIIW